MTVEEYKRDPCGASSLSFWKTEQIAPPPSIAIYRDDAFDENRCPGEDTPYFKLIHDLKNVRQPAPPAGYTLTGIRPEELASHIRKCYQAEYVTDAEMEAYTRREVYDKDLWITLRESATGEIAASGLGELDTRIGEGTLDWIQISPDFRRKGLGKFVVCELIQRLSKKASFVTVSGRMDNPGNPFGLYLSCGFTNPVIWHIVRK